MVVDEFEVFAFKPLTLTPLQFLVDARHEFQRVCSGLSRASAAWASINGGRPACDTEHVVGQLSLNTGRWHRGCTSTPVSTSSLPQKAKLGHLSRFIATRRDQPNQLLFNIKRFMGRAPKVLYQA